VRWRRAGKAEDLETHSHASLAHALASARACASRASPAIASYGPTRLLFARYRPCEAMNENFSLIVMCLFLLGSLAFLAQQLTSYH
jgi:hypothetical protein